MQNPRRLKLVLILGVLLASTLALLAWTQTWVHAVVAGSAPQDLAVTGSTAAPAITALALAGFALAGALTIAGRAIRVVLGLLEVLLGVCVFLSAILAVNDPAHASAAAVTAATGIAGTESTSTVVASASLTPWPFLALAAAVLMAAAGALIIATAGRWPGPTARYQGSRYEAVASPDAAAEGDAVVDWDAQTRGQDPTV